MTALPGENKLSIAGHKHTRDKDGAYQEDAQAVIYKVFRLEKNITIKKKNNRQQQ